MSALELMRAVLALFPAIESSNVTEIRNVITVCTNRSLDPNVSIDRRCLYVDIAILLRNRIKDKPL